MDDVRKPKMMARTGSKIGDGTVGRLFLVTMLPSQRAVATIIQLRRNCLSRKPRIERDRLFPAGASFDCNCVSADAMAVHVVSQFYKSVAQRTHSRGLGKIVKDIPGSGRILPLNVTPY
jgi:hypothetical protein